MHQDEIPLEDLPEWWPKHEETLYELAREIEKDKGEYDWELFNKNKVIQKKFLAVASPVDDRRDEINALIKDSGLIMDAYNLLLYGIVVADWIRLGLVTQQEIVQLMRVMVHWGFIKGYETKNDDSPFSDFIDELNIP
jgi:hypothetical protein